MKPLKERMFWKVLLCIIIGIAFISFIVFTLCLLSAGESNQKNAMEYEKAKEVGFDKVYMICTREDELTLEGTSYILYTARWSSFVDGDYQEDFLIRKDATYIDETEGKTEGLIIYCKVAGFANDPGKYKILEPYKIAIYQQSVDMWAVVGIMVIVVLIEIILVAVLVIYFVMYYAKKNKNPA